MTDSAPNKMARIFKAMTEAGVPMTVREVTIALGFEPRRDTLGPVNVGMHRLETLGKLRRTGQEMPIRWEIVPGASYTGPTAPLVRTDYRKARVPKEMRDSNIGTTITLAILIAKRFTAGQELTYADLMGEFGMSRETAFRWINAWRLVNGQRKVVRDRREAARIGRKRSQRVIAAGPGLVPRL
jgi:hypothetical protein